MNVCKRAFELGNKFLTYVEATNLWGFNASKTLKNQILGQHKFFVDKHFDELSHMSLRYGDFMTGIEKGKLTFINSYNAELKKMINIFGTGGVMVEADGVKMGLKLKELKWTPEALKRFINEGVVTLFTGSTYKAIGFSDMTAVKAADDSAYNMYKLFAEDGPFDQVQLDEFCNIFIDTMKLYEGGGYDMHKLFKFLGVQGGGGDFFKTLFTNSHASMIVAVANSLDITTVPRKWGTMDEVRNALRREDGRGQGDTVMTVFLNQIRAEIEMAGYKPTNGQLERLMADLVGESLFEEGNWKAYYKLISETRSVYQKLKYVIGIVPGTILAVNAATVGTVQFLSKKSGLSLSYKHELIDYLIKEEKMLKSESKYLDVDVKMNDDIGGTYSDWLINVMFNSEKWPMINTLLKSGVQAIPDIVMEQNVKRLSLTRALHSIGVTYKNADEILRMLKDGKKMDFDVNRFLHAQSSIEFKNFFGTSSVFALNRHSWSRNMVINCMQGYMFSRAGELINAFHRFGNAWETGKIQNWTTMVKYLNDPANIELKSFIFMPFHVAKIAYYTDSVLNKDDDTPKAKRLVRYAYGLHDGLQSMEANFFGRIIASVMESTGNYTEYTDMNGDTTTLYGYTKTAAFSTLAAIAGQMYREFKVFNMFSTPIANMQAGYGLNDVIASGMTEADSIMNGMGKFGLLPGLETFDTKKLPQQDDFFGLMLMSINQTNESIKTSNKLRNMSDIESLLNPTDDQYPMIKFLAYLPVIKSYIGKDSNMSATMNSKMMYLLDTDPVIKDLYKGNMNPAVLDSKSTLNLYNELVAMDFSSARFDEGLKSKLKDYGLNDMKGEAFLKLLGDKMGEPELMKKVMEQSPNQTKMGLAQIIAFAENQVPGSSRVLLSYVAKTQFEKTVQEYNMKYKGLDKFTAKNYFQLTPNEELLIKKDILLKYYPDMFAADKTSWFKLVETRLNQLDPKGFTISPELTKFTNSLGFLDLMAYNESRKADSSASYIKNVYSVVGKYVTDPKARINLMIAANQTIQNLPTEQGIRNTMRLGTVLGNIDILDKVLKDKPFVEANKDIIQKALDITFGTVADINTVGLKAAREEIGTAGTGGKGSKAYRQGLYSAGKKYTPGQYDNSNRKAAEELQDKIPSILRNAPASYAPRRAVNPGYSVAAKYDIPTPKVYQDYLQWEKVYNAGKAESAQLVSGYVRRNPADVFDKSTARGGYKSPVFKTVGSYKIPKGKRIWKNPAYTANA